jgi:hypothetical protein
MVPVTTLRRSIQIPQSEPLAALWETRTSTASASPSPAKNYAGLETIAGDGKITSGDRLIRKHGFFPGIKLDISEYKRMNMASLPLNHQKWWMLTSITGDSLGMAYTND